MATTPTLKVEIAFDDTPLTVSPTWTDVTAYVRESPGVSISRGRPDELGTFAAGRASFVLDNNDARFSPLYASSPYNGKLLPGKQVRITGTYGGTDYRLFRGFIVGWPQRFAKGKQDAIVPIVAYDALSKLNEINLPDRILTYMQSLGTMNRFLRTFDGSRWIDAVNGYSALRLSGNIAGTSGIGSGLESGAVQMTSGRMSLQFVGGSSNNGSWSFWIQTTGAGASTSVWMSVLASYADTITNGFIIGIDVNGLVRYQGADYIPGSYATAQSMNRVNDGAPHHVMVSHDYATGITIAIDGQDDTNTSTGYLYTNPGSGGAEMFVGNSGAGSHSAFTGVLQDVASWDGTVLTAAQARRIYELGTMTYFQDTDAAMGDVLDAAGWPSSLRALATNTYGQTVTEWTSGANALSIAQTVAASEQGRFFVDGSGNVTLLSRYSHQLDTTATAIQATFSDDGSDASYQDVGFNYDDLQVRNDVTVTGVAGPASSEDATSITNYGRQSQSISTFLSNVSLAQDMADGLVGWWKDPQVRSLPLSAALTNTAQFASLLGLELGDRIRAEITVPGSGAQSQLELILEQMDWQINGALWDLTVQGSPIPADAFILDTSLLDGADVLGF